MKRFSFFIVVLGFILSGCSTSYHINKAREKCPECFELSATINEVVIKLDTIIKIDTTILVFLPNDTARIDTTIKKLKSYSFKPIYAKNGIINIKVSMTKGTLKVSSHLDSAILYHYQDEILLRDALITKLTTKTVKQTIVIQEQENELKWYEKVLRIGKFVLIGIGLLLFIGIIYKIYKIFYK